ncbi:hypothetical protein L1987_54887 [Smallanthus sonchifolius]|uniref:Uncharacterized protein n=1 Tax=Smallanthus sonchifolius TaxID=185202 RepID=A0ACB9E7V8_9ASTR|nr:hypothetical protein L1987_54887 [Smallanthus sonchifolius]
MSKFSKLEELSIFVNPDAKWWEVEVIEAVLEKLHFLRLENCQVPIYLTLQDFCLKIGHSEPLTSYLKTKLVDNFEKMEKCLKYENGEGSNDDIKELIRHAKALFVCRHWTIEKLSVFDLSRLKYCLLAECNEMHNVVDADEFHGDKIITHDNDGKDAFGCLEYLAIHSMKKLQSIWKGPIAKSSFSCLQVLALHTCPDLTTVFTEGMLDKLHNLKVVIVEDCPKVKSLISWESTHRIYDNCLPNLRKILLLDLPELVSLSNGVFFAAQLDTLLVFNCLKLVYISPYELSSDVKEIKGETEWWDALKNRDEYSGAFVPLRRDGYLMNQLAEDTNSLKEFYMVHSRGGASTMSGSTFVPPDSQLLLAQFSGYETKNHLERGMFMQFLKYRKPPVPLVLCKSDHVIEFLKHLNKFGDIRVHMQSCVLFGHPNPAASCFCPLKEAWGTLEAIATRLRAVYEENRLTYMTPSASGHIQFYLNEVRKSQENALGIPSKKQDFPVLTVEKSSPKKGTGAGTINNERQGFRSPGAVSESVKHIKLPQGILSLSEMRKRSRDRKLGKRTEASTKLQYPIEMSMSKAKSVTEASKILQDPIKMSMRMATRIMDNFRTILQVNIESMEHSLSVDPSSTTFPGTSTQDSSSTYEVKEDYDYLISNIMSLEVSQLRSIAVNASSKGYIQLLVEIYIAERKTMMQSRFISFNTEKWSTYDVKRFEWGVLESLIEIWIKSVKTSFDYLFGSEKQLCEKIFHGLGTDIDDICFEVITQSYQVQVFNIIYTLSFTNPPPDKLFIILDLYETLDHFLNERCSFANQKELFQATVRTQLFTVLSDKITSSLSIFEMVLLYHESSDVFVGAVDPLPMYVMSYLYQLCDHMHAFMKLSLPKLPSIDEDDLILHSEELKGRTELSRHVIWIIMMIMSNLEGKAKLCQDGSAGQFFAMKNISYIVHKIEGHQDLRVVVGDDYFGKLIQKLDHAKVNYLRLELAKIIEMRDYRAE